MIRHLLSLSLFLLVAGLASAQMSDRHSLEAFAAFNKALLSATTLDVTFSSQTVEGAPSRYSVQLAKPNLAKIVTPEGMSVADGSSITIYDSSKNIYFVQPQTDENLRDLLRGNELRLWRPFFDESGFGGVSGVRQLGMRLRKNMSLSVLQLSLDPAGDRTLSLAVDPQDNILRQAEYDVRGGGPEDDILIDTKSLAINQPLGPDTFKFVEPEGARKVSSDEYNADKWYPDIEAAKAVAARTGKLLLVDFYASYKVASNKFDRAVLDNPGFSALSKDFVFVKIDVPRARLIAPKYKVKDIPTVIFMDQNGVEISRTSGNMTFEAFIGQVVAAKKKAGRA